VENTLPEIAQELGWKDIILGGGKRRGLTLPPLPALRP